MALPHLHSFLRCSMWSFMLHHLAVKEMGFAYFSHYSPNPTPNIFIPGKPGQKHQMVMHQCEGSGSLSGSRAFPTSTLPVLCILLSSLMALQSPGWTVLNVLSSSVSRSILTTKCTLWLMMMVSKYEVILYSCQRPSCSFLLLACPRTPAKCCHPSACPSEQRQAVFQCWPWTSFDWGWKRCWMLF